MLNIDNDSWVLSENSRKELKNLPAVYIFRNKINNKYYIGETLNLRRRMSEYFNIPKKRENRPIMSAVKLHGFENFCFEFYYLPDFDKKDLLSLEGEMIKKYNSISPNGYNICKQGTDCTGAKHSLDSRRKISDFHSKKVYQYHALSGDFLKEHDSIYKAALSVNGNACNVSLVANGNRKTAHGYIWKFEKFEKVDTVKRVGITHKQKIYQYALTGEYIGEYDSVTEAANSIGGHVSNIVIVCSGKTKSAGGFIWSYIKSDRVKSIEKPSILQYSMDGDFLKEYKSLADATKSIGKAMAPIYNNCVGHTKSAYGYRWKYNLLIK